MWAQHRVRVWLAATIRMSARVSERDTANMSEHIRRIAIVGTGTIGMSWATRFLARGLQRFVGYRLLAALAAADVSPSDAGATERA